MTFMNDIHSPRDHRVSQVVIECSMLVSNWRSFLLFHKSKEQKCVQLEDILFTKEMSCNQKNMCTFYEQRNLPVKFSLEVEKDSGVKDFISDYDMYVFLYEFQSNPE